MLQLPSNRLPGSLSNPRDSIFCPVATATTSSFGGPEGTSSTDWAAGWIASAVLCANAAADAPWMRKASSLRPLFEVGCGTGIASCGAAAGDAVRAAAAAAAGSDVAHAGSFCRPHQPHHPPHQPLHPPLRCRRFTLNDTVSDAARWAIHSIRTCSVCALDECGGVTLGSEGACRGVIDGVCSSADDTPCPPCGSLQCLYASIFSWPSAGDVCSHAVVDGVDGGASGGAVSGGGGGGGVRIPPVAGCTDSSCSPCAADRFIDDCVSVGAIVVAADTIYDPEPLERSVLLLSRIAYTSAAAAAAAAADTSPPPPAPADTTIPPPDVCSPPPPTSPCCVLMFAQRRSDLLWDLLIEQAARCHVSLHVAAIFAGGQCGVNGLVDTTAWGWHVVDGVGEVLLPPRSHEFTDGASSGDGDRVTRIPSDAISIRSVCSGDVAMLVVLPIV